jgi:hypothetical protein
VNRSLNITVAMIAICALLIPTAIYAQSGCDTANDLIADPSPSCELVSRTAYSFVVELGGEISSIMEKVKSKITGNGGRFEGNSKCGFFHGRSLLGSIKGKYRSISDTEVEVTIEDKPFLVPYRTIESKIKGYLS